MGEKMNEKCGHVKTSLCKDVLKVKILIINSDIVPVSVLYMTRKKKTYRALTNY